jgi:hypothetical protein
VSVVVVQAVGEGRFPIGPFRLFFPPKIGVVAQGSLGAIAFFQEKVAVERFGRIREHDFSMHRRRNVCR